MKTLAKRLQEARTVAEIEAVHAEAIALAARAREQQDLRLLRHAVEIKRRAGRRGGALLAAGLDSDFGARHKQLSKQLSTTWRALAAMSDDQFEANLKSVLRRQSIVVSALCSGIKMTLAPWFIDELGFPTRIVTAVEDPPLTERNG